MPVSSRHDGLLVSCRTCHASSRGGGCRVSLLQMRQSRPLGAGLPKWLSMILSINASNIRTVTVASSPMPFTGTDHVTIRPACQTAELSSDFIIKCLRIACFGEVYGTDQHSASCRLVVIRCTPYIKSRSRRQGLLLTRHWFKCCSWILLCPCFLLPRISCIHVTDCHLLS